MSAKQKFQIRLKCEEQIRIIACLYLSYEFSKTLRLIKYKR